MAYEKQIKCINCGKSIPPMPEDASPEELLCDLCNEQREKVQDMMQGQTFLEEGTAM